MLSRLNVVLGVYLMARYERFTFLCNRDERRLIAALANQLQRSQSDAVRFAIRDMAEKLGVLTKKPKLLQNTSHQAVQGEK
jgi:hypothetical protein